MKKYRIKLENQTFNVEIRESGESLLLDVNGKEYRIELDEIEDALTGSVKHDKPAAAQPAPASPAPVRSAAPAPAAAGGDTITTPMAGLILRVEVAEGDTVTAGSLVCVIEAMKMETEIKAGRDCTIKKIMVAPGDSVQAGQPIIELV